MLLKKHSIRIYVHHGNLEISYDCGAIFWRPDLGFITMLGILKGALTFGISSAAFS
jgi:hypothetical protein